jgi:hypothetical protein
MRKLSVIIACGDDPMLLTRCLTALQSQTLPPEAMETILVDRRERAENRHLAGWWNKRMLSAGVTPSFIYLPARGLSLDEALQRGCRAAAGEVIALVSEAIYPSPEWAADGIAAAEALEFHSSETDMETFESDGKFLRRAELWRPEDELELPRRTAHPEAGLLPDFPPVNSPQRNAHVSLLALPAERDGEEDGWSRFDLLSIGSILAAVAALALGNLSLAALSAAVWVIATAGIVWKAGSESGGRSDGPRTPAIRGEGRTRPAGGEAGEGESLEPNWRGRGGNG